MEAEACGDPRLRHSCPARQNQGKDRGQVAAEVYLQRKRNAADSSRIVLAPRNKHRTVPRALPQSHSCYDCRQGGKRQTPKNGGTRTDQDHEKRRRRPEIRGTERGIEDEQNEILGQGKIFRQKDDRERDGPLPTTYGTTATVLLLLLHLLQDGLLLDLDQIPTFLLAQTEPKLFDALPLFGRRCAPNFVVFGWLGADRSILPVLVRARGI